MSLLQETDSAESMLLRAIKENKTKIPKTNTKAALFIDLCTGTYTDRTSAFTHDTNGKGSTAHLTNAVWKGGAEGYMWEMGKDLGL